MARRRRIQTDVLGSPVVKTIGVLGGMSDVATGEYYRLLNDGVRAHLGADSSADVVIYSVNFAEVRGFIRDRRWEEAAGFLAVGAQRVERAGAEFLLLATNTLHRVAPQVQAAIEIPLVHIVDVTAAVAVREGICRLGVLGTAPVMRAGFYSDRFAEHGIELIPPPPADQEFVDRVIFTELTHGVVDPASTTELLRIVDGLVASGADGIVLACTELSLMITSETAVPTKVFDTTRLHVDRAVRLSLGLEPLGSPRMATS
jgi:aspartate racemase